MRPSWRNNYMRYRSYFLNVLERYRERTDIKIYTEILLSLATIALFSVFALRPTLDTIAQLIKEVDSKKNTLNLMDEKIANVSEAQVIYSQQKNNIELLTIAIPEKPSPGVIVRQVETLSSTSQIKLESMGLGDALIFGKPIEKLKSKPNTEKIPEGLGTIDTIFIIDSDVTQFDKLTKMLSDLENLLTPLVIDNLVFNVISNENQPSYISGTLSGRAVFTKGESIK